MLYRNVDILILDEPTAVLTPQEVDELMVTLKNLKEQGKTIIVITHKLREVMELADSTTVIKHGKVVGNVLKKDKVINVLFLFIRSAESRSEKPLMNWLQKGICTKFREKERM